MSTRGVDAMPPDEPVANAARDALERVLASEAFRAAPQLSAFLAFVVERTLEGRAAELKGYTIAVEAFGRSPDFDPQGDPIVRVEAGRLRRALGQYYAGDGRHEHLRITMPVGTYVPVFETVDLAEDAEEAPGAEEGQVARQDAEIGVEPTASAVQAAAAALTPSRRWPILALGGLFAALATLVAWYFVPGAWVGAPEQERRAESFETSSAPAGRPSAPAPALSSGNLAVIAVRIPETPSDPEVASLLQRFSVLLIDTLVRFDDLVSIRILPAGAVVPADVDYVFEMIVEKTGEAAEGFGRLRSQPDGRIVWTDFASRPLKDGIEAAELADLARGLAARLAEPFGIVHADSRQTATSLGRRCMIAAVDVRRTMTAADHLAARRCLQALTEQEPGFYPAWAYLALLAVNEYAQGFESLAEPPLDRALSAAVTAVRLAPSSARALQAMMEALFARGAIEDALKTGREALSRNPYDPDVKAALGARYVQLNRPNEGLPLLERAISSSPGHPSWYDFYAFLGARLLGERTQAENYGAVIMTEETPAGLLGRAMVAGEAGDKATLEDVLARMGRVAPIFGVDPAVYLRRRGFSPEVAQRILSEIGLAPSRN